MNALRSFETSANTKPATHCHIPADLHLQEHCCGNLISDTVHYLLLHLQEHCCGNLISGTVHSLLLHLQEHCCGNLISGTVHSLLLSFLTSVALAQVFMLVPLFSLSVTFCHFSMIIYQHIRRTSGRGLGNFTAIKFSFTRINGAPVNTLLVIRFILILHRFSKVDIENFLEKLVIHTNQSGLCVQGNMESLSCSLILICWFQRMCISTVCSQFIFQNVCNSFENKFHNIFMQLL